MSPEQNQEGRHVQGVMNRRVRCNMLFRELKESNCRSEAAAVLWMRRMLEIFLQMNKGARSLD